MQSGRKLDCEGRPEAPTAQTRNTAPQPPARSLQKTAGPNPRRSESRSVEASQRQLVVPHHGVRPHTGSRVTPPVGPCAAWFPAATCMQGSLRCVHPDVVFSFACRKYVPRPCYSLHSLERPIDRQHLMRVSSNLNHAGGANESGEVWAFEVVAFM